MADPKTWTYTPDETEWPPVTATLTVEGSVTYDDSMRFIDQMRFAPAVRQTRWTRFWSEVAYRLGHAWAALRGRTHWCDDY